MQAVALGEHLAEPVRLRGVHLEELHELVAPPHGGLARVIHAEQPTSTIEGSGGDHRSGPASAAGP